MDDAHTLMNALALLYIVAWRVLHERDTARFLPDTPAELLVNADEQAVLTAVAGKPVETAADVMDAGPTGRISPLPLGREARRPHTLERAPAAGRRSLRLAARAEPTHL